MSRSRLSWIARVAEMSRSGGYLDLAQGALRLDLYDTGASLPFPDCERHYTSPYGLPALQAAILEYVAQEGIDTSLTEVVVCQGGTGAVACVLLAALGTGDRVLIPSPFWDYHRDLVMSLAMRPMHVPLVAGFRELPDYVDSRWVSDNRIAAIIAVSPSNPTGRCMSASSLARLRAIHAETNVILISDEVYRDLRFEPSSPAADSLYSILGSPRFYGVHSVSKSLGLTGWRIGFALCPRGEADEVARINGLISACAPTPLQHLASTQWRDARRLAKAAATVIRRSVERSAAELATHGFDVLLPDAAPFMFIRDATLRRDAIAVFEYFLSIGIATVPAVDFFPDETSVPWVRLCLSRPEALIDEFLERVTREASTNG